MNEEIKTIPINGGILTPEQQAIIDECIANGTIIVNPDGSGLSVNPDKVTNTSISTVDWDKVGINTSENNSILISNEEQVMFASNGSTDTTLIDPVTKKPHVFTPNDFYVAPVDETTFVASGAGGPIHTSFNIADAIANIGTNGNMLDSQGNVVPHVGVDVLANVFPNGDFTIEANLVSKNINLSKGAHVDLISVNNSRTSMNPNDEGLDGIKRVDGSGAVGIGPDVKPITHERDEMLNKDGVDTSAPVMPDNARSYENTTTGETVILNNTPPVIVREPSTTVMQESEVFAPLPDADKVAIGLSLPSDKAENIEAALNAMPNVSVESSKEGVEWMNRVAAAKFSVPYKGWFDRTAERPDAKYRQSVQSEKGPLTAGGLKFNDAVNTPLSGERAVLRVRALTGLGSVIMVPLWHSGFWLTLKAPTESALLELDRRLNEEKIELGRLTWGLAYANNSVFFAGWLMDFALSHVYDTSLKPEVSANLRSRISALDIPLVVWGLACTIWPNGFPYARAVMDQTNQQNKIIKEKVNVGKLLWVDTASLTPWQIAHMAQRHGSSMTAESLERYKNEFTRGKGRNIKLTENLIMALRTPNVDEYLTSGQKWVNTIVAMVDKAFGMEGNADIRDKYIMDQGKATNMRQYGHFVESLEAGGSIIEDAETLDETLDVLSSNDDIATEYFKGIKEFVEDSTIAMIAIPVTEAAEVSDLPRFPHLLPLDVMSVFFTLTVQKVAQIQSRE